MRIKCAIGVKSAQTIEACSFKRLGALTCRSSISDVYKAMDELRKAMDSVEIQVDINKTFEGIHDEVGGPHVVASKNIAMPLMLAKLGPAVTARLPNIVTLHQFKAVQYIIDELQRQFQSKSTNVINGDANARTRAGKMVDRLEIAMSFMFDFRPPRAAVLRQLPTTSGREGGHGP